MASIADTLQPFASTGCEIARPNVTSRWKALRRVERGLELEYIGACGIALAFLFWPLIEIVAGVVFRSNGPLATYLYVHILFRDMLLLFLLIRVVGKFLCTAVPREWGGKGLVTVAAVQQAAVFLLMYLAYFRTQEWGSLTAVAPPLALILHAGSFVCFILFMRRVCTYLGRENLRCQSNRLFGVVFCFSAAVVAMPTATSIGLNFVAFTLGAIARALLFILAAMYANAIGQLRHAIADIAHEANP